MESVQPRMIAGEIDEFETKDAQGTLLGYRFVYEHGNQHLATVLGVLTLLAFLLDQVQELCYQLFQAA